MESVLDKFFSSVKHTLIMRTDDECCIVYGYNNDTRKYYGFLDQLPLGKTLEELAEYHQLPTS